MSKARRLLALLAAFASVLLSVVPCSAQTGTPIAASDASASGAGDYDVTTFRLTLLFGSPQQAAHPVAARDSDSGTWEPIGVTPVATSEYALPLSRRYLANDGSIRLRISGAGAGRAWAFVVPLSKGQPASGAASATLGELQARSIAYTRLPSQESSAVEVTINQISHALTSNYEEGGLTGLALDGEPLAGASGQTTATDGLTYLTSQSDGDRTQIRFEQGTGNPLRLSVRAIGDRLRFTYHYVAAQPADHALLVSTGFHLPGAFTALQTLNWRRTVQFVSTAHPSNPYAMAQFPFVTATTDSGAYIGVLDTDAGSLFADADPGSDMLSVQQWLWPRTAGESFDWSFEVTAGYEPYANAFLRALDPHTHAFHSDLVGGMGSRYALDSPAQAEQAYRDGVRVIWLHGWFYRNGLYFQGDQPMNQTYTSIWGDTYSYERLKEQVANGQAAGLKVYAYIQFAGVSEDVADQFSDSLVRNTGGNPVVAGSDGPLAGPLIRNMYANPNPANGYGSSLLNQIDQLLTAITPDGIALDRSDRLDFTYGTTYDFGAPDGHASPQLSNLAPRPAGSITAEGQRWMTALRQVLNRHDASLIMNLPITPSFDQITDGTLIDQQMTPWNLFFMRAEANGKPFYILDTTKYPGATDESKGCDNLLLASLTRSQPWLMGGAAQGTGTCPQRDFWPNSRLQYVIPDGSGYPDYWLFAGGTSVLRYQPAEATVTGRFADSSFVPYAA